jgi:ABC-2 type transport system permease protein
MNPSTQFTPTIMQKLLGRQYKWWYLVVYFIVLASATISANIFALFGTLVNFTAISYIWLLNGASAIVMTYLLLGRLYKTITDNFWYDRIGADISGGAINSLLLKPTDYIIYNLIASLGSRLTRNLTNFVGVGVIVFIIAYFKVSLILTINIWLVLLLLPFSIIINYYIAFIIGNIAFFIKDKRDFNGFTIGLNQLIVVLSGAIIPLDKLPSDFLNIIDKLPFAYSLHLPMQIYLGKYDSIQTLLVFAGGIAWCVILYFLAKLIFKLGLKRNEAVGL